MNQTEYMILLLEIDYLSKTLAGLRMKERELLSILQHPKTLGDIHALGKLPRVREDIQSVSKIIEVQTDIANAQIATTYQTKFKFLVSKTLKQYADQLNQETKVPEQEGNVAGQEVRQPEGGAPLTVSRNEQESNAAEHESGGSGVSGTVQGDGKE